MAFTDLAVIEDPAAALEQAEDPEQFVVSLCEQGHAFLARALTFTDADTVVNVKGWARSLQTATRQMQLSKEAQLTAAELVRRAEWRVGQCVRQGQQAGAVRTQREGGGPKSGCNSHPDSEKSTSADYFCDPYERRDAYVMADADPEQVERALDEAKAEKNLTRANVVRKIKGTPPAGPKNEWHRKRRNLDPNRIVRETVLGLDGLTAGLRLIDWEGVEPDDWWLDTVDAALRHLRQFRDQLRGTTR